MKGKNKNEKWTWNQLGQWVGRLVMMKIDRKARVPWHFLFSSGDLTPYVYEWVKWSLGIEETLLDSLTHVLWYQNLLMS